MAKKGLGRGFESLIPTDLLDESFDPTAGDDNKVSELRNIKLAEISPDPDQPRRHFDEVGLQELAASISQHGILQPIVVTTTKSGYEIVAGERRWRAAKRAGLQTIPALVRTLSAQHRLELALIENIQRRDLNALETAVSYAKLRDQFNLSLEEIGQRVGGKSVSAISNTLRLLRLPKTVQLAVAENKIREGQARPLVDLDEKKANELLTKIINENWSARKIEATVTSFKKQGNVPGAKQSRSSIDDELSARFGTEVRLVKAVRGGRIELSFKDEKELLRIKQKLL